MSLDAKRRQFDRNELNYKQYLLKESVVVTDQRKYDLHTEHQHHNCICKHDFRRPWWRRIVTFFAWDIMPAKAETSDASIVQKAGLSVRIDPYNGKNRN